MKNKSSRPIQMKQSKSNIIHVEAKTIMPKYNTHACGHGVFEDKSRKRCNRKNDTRRMIKEAGY